MLLEKLQAISEKEKKRRAQAVECIEQITEAIAGPLNELFGKELPDATKAMWIPTFDKETNEYSFKTTTLYFRYGAHHGQYDTDDPGFYINPEVLFWGDNLTEVKGSTFWQSVKQVSDWLTNYLPGYIEKHDKSRDSRLQYLQDIAGYITKQG
jgi:hypothetical protein